MPDPLKEPINKDLLQNCKTASSAEDLPGGYQNYMMEVKYDGFRLCMRHNMNGSVDVFTRNGKSQNGKLPLHEKLFRETFPRGTVVDGEIAAPYEDEDGSWIQDFERVQSVMLSGVEKAISKGKKGRQLQFFIFDVLTLAGVDMREEWLADRRAEIMELIVDLDPDGLVVLANAFPASERVFEGIVNLGFEGVVAKDIRGTYESGKRGHGWFKLKPQTEVDAVIIGFKPGAKKNSGKVGGVIVGQCDAPLELLRPPRVDKFIGGDYKLQNIGGLDFHSRGSFGAISDEFRDELTADPDSFIGKVVTIKHMGAMPDGRKFRHPEFGRLRPDKVASECGWHDK